MKLNFYIFLLFYFMPKLSKTSLTTNQVTTTTSQRITVFLCSHTHTYGWYNTSNTDWTSFVIFVFTLLAYPLYVLSSFVIVAVFNFFFFFGFQTSAMERDHTVYIAVKHVSFVFSCRFYFIQVGCSLFPSLKNNHQKPVEKLNLYSIR